MHWIIAIFINFLRSQTKYVFSHKEYSKIGVPYRCIPIAEFSMVIRYPQIKKKLDCQTQ